MSFQIDAKYGEYREAKNVICIDLDENWITLSSLLQSPEGWRRGEVGNFHTRLFQQPVSIDGDASSAAVLVTVQ